MSEGGIGSTFMSVAREKIPWWPEVDASKCDGCAGEFDCISIYLHCSFINTSFSSY